MGRWRFCITADAERNLERLDPPIRKRVVARLEWFVENFEEVTPLPLGGMWKGFFKLRVGEWRVIYEVDRENSMVIVHTIGRRDEIYRKSK